MDLGDDPQSQGVVDLIDGATSKQDAPTLIHAFERLCAHLGRRLSNQDLSPTQYSYMDVVDQALQQRGFPLLLSTVLMEGPPIALPEPDDFPTVGHASVDQVKTAARWLADHPLVADDDPTLDGALYRLSEWIEFAAARGDMLVGFCY
jgi:hypothetical protein